MLAGVVVAGGLALALDDGPGWGGRLIGLAAVVVALVGMAWTGGKPSDRGRPFVSLMDQPLGYEVPGGSGSVDWEHATEVLEAAGFGDLARSEWPLRVPFFVSVASVLSQRRLDDLGEANRVLGTANGLASGLVKRELGWLSEHGYVEVSAGWGAALTDRGAEAARVLGFEPY
jgi:hypothetical protein